MATYDFDQIDPAHPPLLDLFDNSDRVLFHGAPARTASVRYEVVNGQSVTTITYGGHAVGFDPGIQIAAAHHDLVFDDGSLLLIGGPRDESFAGGPADDALFGGAGADTLEGRGGANFLQGNQGDDQLVADTGSDTLLGGQGNDHIIAGVFATGPDRFPTEPPPSEGGNFVNGNLGDDSISGGSGDDILLGGQGNDVIIGGRGQDLLVGNLGDDLILSDGPGLLLGEGGADTLSVRGVGADLAGGDGADVFAFGLLGAGAITGPAAAIADWTAEDAIAIANLGPARAYAALVAADFAGALAAADEVIAATRNPGGEVVVVQAGSELYAFVAVIGDVHADFAIRIAGRTLADIGPQDFL